jgi:hypothetical protein
MLKRATILLLLIASSKVWAQARTYRPQEKKVTGVVKLIMG